MEFSDLTHIFTPTYVEKKKLLFNFLSDKTKENLRKLLRNRRKI